MPERERPSLTGLAINKKPLIERGKPVVSLDAAESTLLGQQPPASRTAALDDTHTLGPISADGDAAPPAAAVSQAAPARATAAPSSRPDGHTTIQPTIQSPSRLQPKKKEIRIAWTFKIPHELHQELSAVASYNDLTMSDIVIEAIQLHLPHFPHPEHRRR